MERKLIQQGNSTLMVSLPSTWIKKNGLSKGSLVNIEEEKNDIKIYTSKIEKKLKAKVKINEKEIPLRRVLLSLYEKGIDEIEIDFPQELIIEIERIVNELIGFEIIEQNKNYCLIQEITNTSQNDFENIIRRLFLLTKSMLEDGLIAIKNNDKELIEHLEYRDIDINKFSYYCKRLINKNNDLNFDKISYYQIVESLEFIGDEIKRLFWHLIKSKSKFSKKDIELYEKVNILFNDCYTFVYNPKEILLKKIRKDYVFLRNNFLVDNKDLWIRHYLFNILDLSIKIERTQISNLKNVEINK